MIMAIHRKTRLASTLRKIGVFAAAALLLSVQAGCVVRRPPVRSSFETASARSSSLVFDSPAVRAAMRQRGVGPDASRWEYARNNADLGVRTQQQTYQGRLYRGSDWYSQPAPVYRDLYSAPTGAYRSTLIYSPSQARSNRRPY